MTLDPLIAATLRVSFGVFFGIAVMHKIAHFRAFATTVKEYVKDSPLERHTAVAGISGIVVILEVALVAAWAVPSARLAPGAGTATVLLGYAMAMYAKLRSGNVMLDCGCSWGQRRQPVSRTLVIRNVVLAAIALAATLPVLARPLTAIDFISIAAASSVAVTLYSSVNLLLAVRVAHQEAR